MRLVDAETEKILVKIIKAGEWSLLDLKQYLWPLNKPLPREKDKQEFAADCSSIANAGGGLLVVGPPDKEDRKSLPKRPLTQEISDLFLRSLKDRTSPPLSLDSPIMIDYYGIETFVFEIPPSRTLIRCDDFIYYRTGVGKEVLSEEKIDTYEGLVAYRSRRPTEIPQFYSQVKDLLNLYSTHEAASRILRELRVILHAIKVKEAGGWPGSSWVSPSAILSFINEETLESESRAKLSEVLTELHYIMNNYAIGYNFVSNTLDKSIDVLMSIRKQHFAIFDI